MPVAGADANGIPAPFSTKMEYPLRFRWSQTSAARQAASGAASERLAVGDDGGGRVAAEDGGGNLGVDRAVEGAGEDRGLAGAAGEEDDAARGGKRGEAEGHGMAWYRRLAPPIGGVGADRIGGERDRAGAAVEGAAGLVEAEMAVGAEAENGEIDAAEIGDDPFHPRRLGVGVRRCRVESVDTAVGNGDRVKKFAAQPQEQAAAVFAADAGILVKGDDMHGRGIEIAGAVGGDEFAEEAEGRLPGREDDDRGRLASQGVDDKGRRLAAQVDVVGGFDEAHHRGEGSTGIRRTPPTTPPLRSGAVPLPRPGEGYAPASRPGNNGSPRQRSLIMVIRRMCGSLAKRIGATFANSSEVRQGHVLVPFAAVGPVLVEGELGRVIVVLVQVILDAAGLRPRRVDEAEEEFLRILDLVRLGDEMGDDGELGHGRLFLLRIVRSRGILRWRSGTLADHRHQLDARRHGEELGGAPGDGLDQRSTHVRVPVTARLPALVEDEDGGILISLVKMILDAAVLGPGGVDEGEEELCRLGDPVGPGDEVGDQGQLPVVGSSRRLVDPARAQRLFLPGRVDNFAGAAVRRIFPLRIFHGRSLHGGRCVIRPGGEGANSGWRQAR